MTKTLHILPILFILLLSSLACLTTVETSTLATTQALPSLAVRPAQDGVSDIADPEQQETPQAEQSSTTPSERCARVTALEAVHLRTGATEHSPALDWLLAGEIVFIPPGNAVEKSPAEAGWTLVTAGDLTGYPAGLRGYVRAIYLQETDCPK